VIKIKTKKKVIRGEKVREIIEVTGVILQESLPKSYFETVPYIEKGRFNSGKEYVSIFLVNGVGGCTLEAGEQFGEKAWEETFLPGIKKAGEKLHQLRIQEKQLKEDWEGEETFVI